MNQPKNIALTALALLFMVVPGYAAEATATGEASPAQTPVAVEEEAESVEDVVPTPEESADSETSAPEAEDVTGQPAVNPTGQNATEKSVPAVDHGADNAASHSAGTGHHLPSLDWSFNGPFGTYDKASLQRGFLVYKQVCSSCHALKKVYYRNLSALGYNEAQIKAIAAEYTVMDGPNDEGEMFERPARPSDRIKSPFENDKAAAYANNGAVPPDLSLITKARHGGADYVYGILTGYAEPPEGVALTSTQYYNKVKDGGLIDAAGHHIPGGILAMAPPLSDGMVAYEDKTPQTLDQYARDVSHFLTWAAEPEMEVRKQMGAKVMIFLAVFALIMYAVKRRVWEKLH